MNIRQPPWYHDKKTQQAELNNNKNPANRLIQPQPQSLGGTWQKYIYIFFFKSFDDEIQPGKEFLVIHLDQVWIREGLADCVLDNYHKMLNCSDTFVVLGQIYPKLNVRELQIQS